MPKTISNALKAHLAGEVTSLCTCWRIVRRDATEFFFTDHDQDLVISGDTYVSAIGYTRSAMSADSDMSVDNIEMTGIFDDDSITDDDLRSGLWDHADVYVFLVNWDDLTQGIMRLRRGRLGDVQSTPSGVFKTELHGIVSRLQNVVGDLYSPLCRADLGDDKCGVDLEGDGWMKTATVASVTSRRVFVIDVDEERAVDGWFTDGVVTFTSGNNAGRSMEVKGWTQSSSSVELFLGMPYAIEAGDELTIYPGCDKTVAMCRDRYDNILNFRGEPYVPGLDAITQGPESST